MTRLFIIILFFVNIAYVYSDSRINKISEEDKKCIMLLNELKKSKSNANVYGLLDYLLVNTSHSKISLNTIETCNAELIKIFNSHDSLKKYEYLNNYYHALLSYCKGDVSGFKEKITSVKSLLLKSGKLVEYATINNQAGNFLSIYNVVDLRFEFYRDNLKIFNRYKNTNWQEQDIQNCNNLAFLYENINKLDSAEKYYRIGLDIALRDSVEVWVGLMSGNIGNIYLTKGQYNTAEYLLLKDLEVSHKYKMSESALNVLHLLIQIKNHQKKYLESKLLLDSTRFYFNKIDTVNNNNKSLFINKYLFSKAEIFMGIGNYDSARYYYKKANDFLYSRNRLRVKNEKALLNRRYNFEENIKYLADLREHNRLIYFISIVAVILLTFSFLILIILSRFNRKFKIKAKELEELNLQKDKLFSIISHDVKAPLNTLQGLLHLYNINAISQSDFVNYKDDINKTINDISGNLNNLLMWASRSMTSGLKVEKSDVLLTVLINEVISQFSIVIKNKNLQFKLIDNYHGLIRVDRNLLFVVISNLVNNAIKFTDNGKSIEIKISTIDDNIQIEIHDQGIGIPSTKLETIFSLNTNKSTLGTSGEKGTGLGLIICNDFVKLMGGSIQVESTVNVGTRFIIILPVS